MEKRTADKLSISRRTSTLPHRDQNHKNGHIQFCNRIGCSTRLYAMESSQIGDREKARHLKASSRSMSSKTISGNTSRSVSTSSDYRKPCLEERKPTSMQEMTSTEALESGETKSTSRKQSSRHWELGFQGTSPSSSGQSLASKNTRQIHKHNSQIAGSVAHKHGLRSVSSRAVPDMVRKGIPSEGLIRKRPSIGEISTARGKTVASGGYSLSRQRGLPAPSPSHPVCSVPQQTSSRYRKPSTSRSGASSVRTRLASSVETRYPEQDGSSLSVPTMASELPRMQFSTDSILPESPSRFFANGHSSTICDPTGWSCSSSESAHNSPVGHSEDGSTELNGALMDGDGYHRFTTAGVAENAKWFVTENDKGSLAIQFLLALERIEQDEDFTYEELLVLESNLSLDDLAFYDQHRNMRLDIDNMSYEELLALTEEMGTVSTAPTEEALSRCLNISIYGSLSVDPGATGRKDNDTKCSICQEEYAIGDQMGKLTCEHLYHAGCICQWLGQKNWCPICRMAACTS